jgi:transcriptional regulator with XRE-family HTH domain
MQRKTVQLRQLGRLNIRLIEARLNRGWSPNQLAGRAGISGNTVRAAERGDYIAPRSQFAIAEALGLELLDLFPFERQRLAA